MTKHNPIDVNHIRTLQDTCYEKDAEISRLTARLRQGESLMAQALDIDAHNRQTITELCDALENAWKTGAVNTGTPPLLPGASEIARLSKLWIKAHDRIVQQDAEIERLKAEGPWQQIKCPYCLKEHSYKPSRIIREQKQLITEVTDFISACRYAGPDGLDTLKKEAFNLYGKLPE